MYGFIYLTTNLVNNRKYIGKCEYSRKNGWKDYLGSGVALKNAVQLYGRENFKRDILTECESQEELDLKEVEFISMYNACESEEFYNIASGGEGGNTRLGMSDEQYEIYCKNQSRPGDKNGMYGKKHKESTKSLIGDSTKERFRNDEFVKGFGDKVKLGMAKAKKIVKPCAVCGNDFEHIIPKAKYCQECKAKYSEHQLSKLCIK